MPVNTYHKRSFKHLVGGISLIAIGIALFLYVFFLINFSLLPTSKHDLPLYVNAVSDAIEGGDTAIVLHENNENIYFDFTLSKDYPLPYANLNLMFGELARDAALMDLSHYSEAIIKIRCTPRNELAFMLHTYENKLTKLQEISSYRKAAMFFTCDEVSQDIHIDLHRLVTPEWWLNRQGLSLSSQQYALDKVKGISFTNTAQSPRNQTIAVHIEAIYFRGFTRAWWVIGISSAFTLIGFAILYLPWRKREGTAIGPAVHANKKSSPDVREADATQAVEHPQQPLLIQSKRERESEALVDYLQSHYADAGVSLEQTAEKLGMNRTKINQLLKEKTGQTFSAYLNKLRLTEAARLLGKKHMTVSEAAFAVGFGSLSYFNRVFKKEFGCSPSAYRVGDDSSP